jgi:hypothetical protein
MRNAYSCPICPKFAFSRIFYKETLPASLLKLHPHITHPFNFANYICQPSPCYVSLSFPQTKHALPEPLNNGSSDRHCPLRRSPLHSFHLSSPSISSNPQAPSAHRISCNRTRDRSRRIERLRCRSRRSCCANDRGNLRRCNSLGQRIVISLSFG